jgi:hypothetical protein
MFIRLMLAGCSPVVHRPVADMEGDALAAALAFGFVVRYTEHDRWVIAARYARVRIEAGSRVGTQRLQTLNEALSQLGILAALAGVFGIDRIGDGLCTSVRRLIGLGELRRMGVHIRHNLIVGGLVQVLYYLVVYRKIHVGLLV